MRNPLVAVCILMLFPAATALCQSITPSGPLSFCTGSSVTLSASAGNSFQWQKNGAPIGGANSQNYTATTSGVYSVIITTNGSLATAPDVTVTVKPNPTASFSNPGGAVCSGSPAGFSANASGGTPPYTYAWSFGGGGTASVQNPTHTFTALGCGNANFTNSLTVTDANGCPGSTSGSINILQSPDVQLQDNNIFSPFSNCENSPTPNNPNYTITVNNISPGNACVSSYSLNWGDGSPVLTGLSMASFPLTHTYSQVGAFNLTISGMGANGCTGSKTYTIANQSNPDIGIGTFGPTEGCANLPVNIVITTWQNNSPGTTYKLLYGDGTSRSMNHPINNAFIDDTTTHSYTSTSCPNSQGYPLTITATNACRTKQFTGGNIQVKTKPNADFVVATNPACAGQSVCFTNKTNSGYYTDCSTNTSYSWNFGDPASGAANTSASASPCHTFAAAGSYTITLTTGNPCGSSTITKQICVNDPAVPAFTLDNNSICLGGTVAATNSSAVGGCASAAYQWSVTYAAGFCGNSSGWSFAPGSSATSTNPSFVFSKPGTYTIKLAVTGSCGNAVVQKTVSVKQKPTLTLSPVASGCTQATICPTANVTNCGAEPLTYNWEFDGGAAGASQNATPSCITFSTGAHTMALSVSNECGASSASQNFGVGNPPNLAIPASASFCAGENTGAFALTTTTPGATIGWTNNNTGIGLPASGSGSINAIIAANAGSTTITATITVNALLNGCATSNSFTITVKPKPATPAVGSPVNYCHNDAPSPLIATATPGNDLLWYPTPTGGTGDGNAPTPLTSATGSTIYYVSQKNSATGCESNRAAIAVNVSAIPQVTGNTLVNPSTCASASGSILLNGLTPSTSYTIQYTKNSGIPVTVSLTANGAGSLTIPGLTAGTYSAITVSRNGCTSAMVGPFTLADPNQPSPPTVGNAIDLCAGNTLSLTAQSAITGVSWAWTGPNNFSSNQQNPAIGNITTAGAGTYSVTITSNNCTSQSTPLQVVVNPRPVAPAVTAAMNVCLHDAIHLTATSSFPNAVSWLWNGPNGFTSTDQDPVIRDATAAMTGMYNVTATAIAGSCTSPPATISLTVLPVPVITGASHINPIGCNAATGAIVLTGLQGALSYTVVYTKDGAQPVSKTGTANPDGSIIISGLTAGNYTDVHVSLSGCASNNMGPFELTDTAPFSVIAQSNGPLCEGNNLLLSASATSTGSAAYAWTGPAGFTSILQNPVIPAANTAHSGIYEVAITINGCSAKGKVTATVASPSVGGQTAADTTVCQGKNGGTISLAEYNGSVVRWEASVNNGLNWAPVTGTSPFLNYTNLTATTWYRALVQNGVCAPAYSTITVITVINSVQQVFLQPAQITTCNHDTTITFTASVTYTGADPVKYYWYIITRRKQRQIRLPTASGHLPAILCRKHSK